MRIFQFPRWRCTEPEEGQPAYIPLNTPKDKIFDNKIVCGKTFQTYEEFQEHRIKYHRGRKE